MSNQLGFFSDLIPPAALISDMQATIKGLFTSAGWRVHYEQVPGTIGILDLLPPATETIGDGSFFEVVRLTFSALAIQIQAYPFCYANGKGQTRIVAATATASPYGAGAVAHGLTINGVTVTGAVGAANATANDNHRSLYEALRASTDPTITDWNFYYFYGNPSGAITDDAIICVRKTVSATMLPMGATNCTLTAMTYGTPYIPVMTAGQLPPIGFTSGATDAEPLDITVDLTNGWIYFLSIFSRTFYLGSRTVSGRYGPLVATWADHADALAALPPGRFASPLELFIGCMDTSVNGQTDSGIYLRPAKFYCFANQCTDVYNASSTLACSRDLKIHPWLAAVFGEDIHDSAGEGVESGSSTVIPDYVLAVSYGVGPATNAVVNKDPITPLAIRDGAATRAGTDGTGYIKMGTPLAYNPTFTTISGIRFTPAYDLPDLFHGLVSAPDETVHIAATDVGATATTVDLDDTTAYTSVTLVDGSAFPATGGNFILRREVWGWTGKSSVNVLTGVTRGLNGSKKVRSWAGDTVRVGKWFVKFNAAAIPTGYTAPV